MLLSDISFNIDTIKKLIDNSDKINPQLEIDKTIRIFKTIYDLFWNVIKYAENGYAFLFSYIDIPSFGNFEGGQIQIIYVIGSSIVTIFILARFVKSIVPFF